MGRASCPGDAGGGTLAPEVQEYNDFMELHGPTGAPTAPAFKLCKCHSRAPWCSPLPRAVLAQWKHCKPASATGSCPHQCKPLPGRFTLPRDG